MKYLNLVDKLKNNVSRNLTLLRNEGFPIKIFELSFMFKWPQTIKVKFNIRMASPVDGSQL